MYSFKRKRDTPCFTRYKPNKKLRLHIAIEYITIKMKELKIKELDDDVKMKELRIKEYDEDVKMIGAAF
jgi:hypothetical protein